MNRVHQEPLPSDPGTSTTTRTLRSTGSRNGMDHGQHSGNLYCPHDINAVTAITKSVELSLDDGERSRHVIPDHLGNDLFGHGRRGFYDSRFLDPKRPFPITNTLLVT